MKSKLVVLKLLGIALAVMVILGIGLYCFVPEVRKYRLAKLNQCAILVSGKKTSLHPYFFREGRNDYLFVFSDNDAYCIDLTSREVCRSSEKQMTFRILWMRFLKHGPNYGARMGTDKYPSQRRMRIEGNSVLFENIHGDIVLIRNTPYTKPNAQ